MGSKSCSPDVTRAIPYLVPDIDVELEGVGPLIASAIVWQHGAGNGASFELGFDIVKARRRHCRGEGLGGLKASQNTGIGRAALIRALRVIGAYDEERTAVTRSNSVVKNRKHGREGERTYMSEQMSACEEEGRNEVQTRGREWASGWIS
jgi:hypothetical protein